MEKRGIFIIVTILLLLSGAVFAVHHKGACLAGGGSAQYTAPEEFTVGAPLVLELKLSRWGAPQCMTDQVIDHFTEVKCHFRAKGAADYATLDMQGTVIDNNNVSYSCTIPAKAVTSQIEYYFDYKMDGVYSRRDEPVLESAK